MGLGGSGGEGGVIFRHDGIVYILHIDGVMVAALTTKDFLAALSGNRAAHARLMQFASSGHFPL